MNATATTTRETARIIRDQIGGGSLMSLGAHDFRAGDVAVIPEAPALPSLIFNARILPFNSKGERTYSPRIMQVVVSLNANDYYDIHVSYNKRGDRYGTKPPVVHFEADDVDAESLSRVMLALDYDGETALNPRLA